MDKNFYDLFASVVEGEHDIETVDIDREFPTIDFICFSNSQKSSSDDSLVVITGSNGDMLIGLHKTLDTNVVSDPMIMYARSKLR